MENNRYEELKKIAVEMSKNLNGLSFYETDVVIEHINKLISYQRASSLFKPSKSKISFSDVSDITVLPLERCTSISL